jgi:pyruvate,orthophosphate dikinase
MPGMLDTVLDVGCTPAAVRGLVRSTGNPRFAWDCRRRFLEGYAETVLGLDPAPFAARLAGIVAGEGVDSDRDLDSEALERIAAADQA